MSLAERCAVVLQGAVESALGPAHAGIDPLLRPTQDPRFGDLQANLAMSLAKQLGRKPRDLALAIVEALPSSSPFAKVEVAGPGFINLTLKPEVLAEAAQELSADPGLGLKCVSPETIVVDYSSPNVAKEMHVGHLRSTIIGDAIVRVLESQGHRVIRQNHLGDWGTQFGMLIENLLDQGYSPDRGESVGELTAVYRAAKERFDADSDFRERARRRVVALQAGDAESLAVWRALVHASAEYFAGIYRRLGIKLEEADIRGESFYNDRLPGVVARLRNEGHLAEDEGAKVVYPTGFQNKDGNRLPLIVQKSDGGYLYATTDLAAALYRTQELGATRVIYVMGLPQRQHFEMFTQALRQFGWVPPSARFDHVGFGSVLGEDKKLLRTRAGESVKLVQLLDEAEERALRIVQAKNPELSAEQAAEIGRAIGIGALKYADLSSDRVKDYVFSWERMLSFDGNTAPYLVNAYVRIRSIFRRAGGEATDAAAIRVEESSERALVLLLCRFSETVDLVTDTLQPHHMAGYLYELAKAFHAFYEACPVAKAGVPAPVRASRLALCALVSRVLARGLDLLGIPTVEQM